MDFIIEILESGGCTTMVVITNRLSKGVVAGELPNLIVKALVR